MDRIAPTRRPGENAIGYQRWSDLSFLHWEVPAEQIAPLIPTPLSLDTWNGSAWIGLVPFTMSGIRPWWFPAVPGVSAFHETNVRTYVHLNGENPGVWFFSLEAANSLPVWIARRRWSLPYHRAEMSLKRSGDRIQYHSRRLWPGTLGATCNVEVEIGQDLRNGPGQPVGNAVPGTLEHFLAERYYLYTIARTGKVLRGQVHHCPYPLKTATTLHCEETLIADAGITVSDRPDQTLFSPGVSVEIFSLREVQA